MVMWGVGVTRVGTWVRGERALIAAAEVCGRSMNHQGLPAAAEQSMSDCRRSSGAHPMPHNLTSCGCPDRESNIPSLSLWPHADHRACVGPDHAQRGGGDPPGAQGRRAALPAGQLWYLVAGHCARLLVVVATCRWAVGVGGCASWRVLGMSV